MTHNDPQPAKRPNRPVWEISRQPGDPSFLEWLTTYEPKLAEDLRFKYKAHILLKRLGLAPTPPNRGKSDKSDK
jgi:hypothetical protein